MMKLSRRFIEAVRVSPLPSHRLVRDAGDFHPSLLSKWVTGAQRVREHDARVIAVGRLLGLAPDECFEADQPEPGGGRSTSDTPVGSAA